MRLTRLARPHPSHPSRLRRQLAEARAEIASLKAELQVLTLRRHTGARDVVTLKRLIQPLARPSLAGELVSPANGPTLYWLCVKHFQVDETTARIIAQTKRPDWKSALAALDQHVF